MVHPAVVYWDNINFYPRHTGFLGILIVSYCSGSGQKSSFGKTFLQNKCTWEEPGI